MRVAVNIKILVKMMGTDKKHKIGIDNGIKISRNKEGIEVSILKYLVLNSRNSALLDPTFDVDVDEEVPLTKDILLWFDKGKTPVLVK